MTECTLTYYLISGYDNINKKDATDAEIKRVMTLNGTTADIEFIDFTNVVNYDFYFGITDGVNHLNFTEQPLVTL